jgi:multiple antibiotic resistance protein
MFLESTFAFIAILNPFALCLYVGAIIDDVGLRAFSLVLLRACMLSVVVFLLFGYTGEYVLSNVLQIEPEAMRVFGGIIFLIAGYNYVMKGYRAAVMLRGSLEELPSAIALPYMIGAGTITQAILVGKHNPHWATASILVGGVVFSFVVMISFGLIREHMKGPRERVFERYVNTLARLNGLVIGALSVQMIVRGLHGLWLLSEPGGG